jgi:predicted porin
MKKSLIALAVLAASGAAMAQSSVTVYGIADIWFGSTKSLGESRQTVLDSGGVSGSRFGFKGSEDLGGGLKANFLLEQGFNLDKGTASDATKAFNRQAYVGLSGGFGEVKLGNVYTAYDDISGATNGAFDSILSANNGVFRSTAYSARPGNNVYYASPSFGGFSGAVSYAFGENKTATQSASSTTALHVKYENGPIYVGAAYQRQKPVGTGDALKYGRINGSYDFGVAKLLASYGKTNSNADGDVILGKTNEYLIGVDVPLGGALTLSADYATSKTKSLVAANRSKRSGYGLALAYGLSKRTTVYTGFHSDTEKDDAGVKTDKNTIYAVGLKHTF